MQLATLLYNDSRNEIMVNPCLCADINSEHINACYCCCLFVVILHPSNIYGHIRMGTDL